MFNPQQMNWNNMIVTLSPQNNPQTYMTAENMGQQNGTRLSTGMPANGWQCGPHQMFKMQQRPDGRWSFMPMHAQHLAVDMTGGNANHIHLWGLDPNNANQGFSVEPSQTNPGAFWIRSHLGSLCDCDLGTGGNAGSKIHFWDQTGAPNQAWNIQPHMGMSCQGGFNLPEGFVCELYNRHNPQNPSFLSVMNGEQQNGAKMVSWNACNGMSTAPFQRFRIHRRADGSVSLHPMHAPHMAVDTTGGNANHMHIWQADDNNINQSFMVMPHPAHQGAFMLQSKNLGSLMDMDLATGGANGSKIHMWGDNTGAPNQAWEMRPVWG